MVDGISAASPIVSARMSIGMIDAVHYAAKPGAGRNVKGMLGIWPVRVASMDFLGHRISQKWARRWSSALILALSAVVSVSICVLPARTALAEQILELPQESASPASVDAPAEVEPQPKPRRQPVTPIPSGVGSIEEYESQGESDGPARFASGPSNPQIDVYGTTGLSGNRGRMVNNVLLGALALGLLAMELHAAHHHHR